MDGTTNERDGNFSYWTSQAVADHWRSSQGLQPAEAVIFDEWRTWISSARVLDLGIGTGRTSAHLIPACAEYVGTDYSASMIKICREKFAGGRFEHARFEVADARSLPFADRSFDLVMFSFNGIDYVPHGGRIAVLAEVRRVLRPQGRFALSTHNAEWLRKCPGYRRGESVSTALERNADWLRIRYRNRDRDLQQDACTVREPPLDVYYAAPPAMIRQLEAAGFTSIVALGGEDGKRIDVSAETAPCRDPWVYFACGVPGATGA